MKIYKEKSFLIFDFEDGRNVKYDFATKCCIGIKGKPVDSLHNQLNGLTMNQMIDCCSDPNYANFLRFVQKNSYWSVSRVSTVLQKIAEYSKYEQFFSAGLEDIIDMNFPFHYSIGDIPKSMIKVARTNHIQLRNEYVRFWKLNPDAHYIGYTLDFLSLTSVDIFKIWTTTTHVNYREQSCFNLLINQFGYNAKSLFLYIDHLKTFEAIEDIRYLTSELYDYASMMSQISGKFDRYPRHFLTTHKIAIRNYNRLKVQFEEAEFQKHITPEYECIINDYRFIYPKTTQEIKDESVVQHNCVSSYIDRVLKDQCHIMFLRKKDTPNTSLVTLEIRNNHIVQARRKFNDPVTAEDQVVIDKWNDKYRKDKAA